MMILILSLVMQFALADAPLHWNQMNEIQDRHEFYKNNEMVVKPKDSWQTLFSVVYTDVDLVKTKDCVFFRVPGANQGSLKIKTISGEANCEKFLLEPGDKSWDEIKSLQFSTDNEKLTLDMTFPQYQNEKWLIDLQNKFERPEAKMHLSSADYKNSKIIFLSPKQLLSGKKEIPNLKAKTVCHEINDECEELKPSVCSQCADGWYEIPNGCVQGPKYCGRVECGERNAPACRRGMVWQREDKIFDCRTDASFAYCSKGLSVQCQGRQAFCR